MRRRRRMTVAALLAGLIAALFFTVGQIGGPTDEGDGARPPRPPLPEPVASTASNVPAPTETPTVKGSVRGTDGEPLAGVTVRIVALGDGKRSSTTIRTDAKGRYADGALAGGNVIFTEILKKGYPATRRRYEDGPSIEPGETLVLDLEFPRTFSLAGFVKSVDGKIVEGAQVRYGTIGIATSDEFGKFRIENIDSSVLKREVHPRLMTSAPGFVTDEKTLHLDGKTANFDDIDVVLHE